MKTICLRSISLYAFLLLVSISCKKSEERLPDTAKEELSVNKSNASLLSVSNYFTHPEDALNGTTIDKNGTIYFQGFPAEGPEAIKKVDFSGIVTTIIRSSFNSESELAVDKFGNIFVADLYYQGGQPGKIFKITPAGQLSVYADSVYYPAVIGTGPDGSVYFIELGENNASDIKLFRINPSGKRIYLAGSGIGFKDGKGKNAKFNKPLGLVVDKSGNVFLADTRNQRIRKITPDGKVTTIAGSGRIGSKDGVGCDAEFMSPFSITMSPEGTLFVADHDANKIKKVSVSGEVTTYAGTGEAGIANGLALEAKFDKPVKVLYHNGSVFVQDRYYSNYIRVIK